MGKVLSGTAELLHFRSLILARIYPIVRLCLRLRGLRDTPRFATPWGRILPPSYLQTTIILKDKKE